MVGYRGPSASHPDTMTLDLLQYALAVGQGSRLTKALVFEQEMAVSASVDWSWRVDPGAFTIHLELKPGADPKECEEALYRELDRVVKDGLETREVEKACNNLQAQLLRELATNNGRAHALGHYEMMLGSWQEGLALASRYALIKKEELQKAAATYLSPLQRSVVTLMPREEAS